MRFVRRPGEKRLNKLEGVAASVNFASEQAAGCFDPLF